MTETEMIGWYAERIGYKYVYVDELQNKYPAMLIARLQDTWHKLGKPNDDE
jgi:hypothetical protein